MILEEATKEAFGYYPRELPPQGRKPILAACNLCGKFRITSKNAYRTLCHSCTNRGENSSNWKGGKHKHFCKECCKEFEVWPSEIKRDSGKYCSRACYLKSRGSGIDKIKRAKRKAQRRRELGYTLLMPLKDNEVGHHVTNEYIIGVPKDVHERLCGGGRTKHRTKVLQWLKANDKKKYKLVLCVLAKEPLCF